MPVNTISGIAAGDAIDLTFSATNSVSFDSTMLIVTGGGTTDMLSLAGVAPGTQFILGNDGQGGTTVVAAAATGTSWSNPAGGDWTVAGNWANGVPTLGVDATLGVVSGSYYLVTLTTSGAARSLTLAAPATLDVHSISGGPASLAIAGDLTNGGTLILDSSASSGGSTVMVGGMLANAGSIDLYGGSGINAGRATLEVGSPAPAIWTGQLTLSGSSVIEFQNGTIGSIASGASIAINGGNAFVANSGAPASNSALTGLTTNSGTLSLTSGAVVDVSGSLTNSGSLFVDYVTSGGSTLSIGGALTNASAVYVGGRATLDVQGGFLNTGVVYFSYSFGGGSTLSVGGTLTNSGSIYIGNSSETLANTVTAAALANTGTIQLDGGSGTNTTETTLAIAATPLVLTGSLSLYDHSQIVFGDGGSIGAIASGASLFLIGGNAFVADAVSPGSNSALAQLASNAGALELEGGEALQLQGDFTNFNTFYLDLYYGGGSSVTVAGTFDNTGYFYIGNSGYTAGSTTVTTSYLLNTGTIDLNGGTGTSTYRAVIDVTSGAAPSLLTGTFNLYGDALVSFAGSGSITGIATGATVLLNGAAALIANATDLSSNSALAGLTSNSGILDLQSGASLHVRGNLSNDYNIDVDYFYYGVGGSSLTIDGQLTNAGFFGLGGGGSPTTPSTVTAAALANTGVIQLIGGTGTSTYQAVLDITSGAAPPVVTGDLILYGNALVEFASGQITAIASGSEIYLSGPTALIADQSNPGNNSALSGLASNAGYLYLDGGAAIHTLGDFSNFATIVVNPNSSYGSASGALTIDGVLTNTGQLTVGQYYQATPTTVTAAALDNRGSIYINGGTGTAAMQSALVITSGAAPQTLLGVFSLSGDALVEFAAGGIASIARNAQLVINGSSAFVADSSDTASNSALTQLGTNAGFLDLEGGAVVHTQTDLVNFGTLYLDSSYSGGSSLTVDGTLTNTGYVSIGQYYISATTTMSVGALANGATITLQGGAGSFQAVLDIGGASTDSGTITLYQNALLSASSLTVVNGGNVVVNSGGTALGVTVGIGGRELLGSGGTAGAATIAGGLWSLPAARCRVAGSLSSAVAAY